MADFIPEWENTGVEPSEQLKQNGFQAGFKPPAGVLNWFFNKLIKRANENTFDYYYELDVANYNLIDFDVYTEKGTYKLVTGGNTVILIVTNPVGDTIWQLAILSEGIKSRRYAGGTWYQWNVLVKEEEVNQRMKVGTYVGLGDWTQNNHFANLGYKPKKIEIVPAKSGNFSATVLIQDCPFSAVMRSTNEAYGISLEWTNNGVRMTPYKSGSTNTDYPTVLCDEKDVVYHYIIYK